MGRVFLLVLFVCSCHVTYSEDVYVETEYGLVRGKSMLAKPGPNSPASMINTFLNIPFAKSPTGELRWKPPVKPDNYKGIKDATTLGPACIQNGEIFLLTQPLWNKYSEDCLNLNVFAPNKTGSFPVMLWIHGGGYMSSSNAMYTGHYLAAMDVVVVVINYRLGVFGFLTTEDGVAPGNYGLLDQHFALEWNKRNIAKFGGDPNRVTIFGQSAGASSVGLHIVSEKSKGLFHQAILQSGSDLTPWAINFPHMGPSQFTRATAKAVDCPTSPNKDMVECMKKVDAETLLKNVQTSMPPGYITLGFTPTVDHDFLIDEPAKLRAQGKVNKVKSMAGITSEDGSLYVAFWVPALIERGFNRSEYVSELRRWSYQLMPEFKDAAFEAVDFEYTNWPKRDDLEANRKTFVDLFTDFGMGAGVQSFLDSQAQHSDTYQFILGYRSTNTTQIFPEWMGVPHNGELPFVFCYPCNLMPENDHIFDQMEMKPFSIIDWNHEDMEYSNYVMKLWTNFAKFGNPTPTPVSPPFNQAPMTWHAYGHNDTQYYLDMHRDGDKMKKDYNAHKMAFWNYFVEAFYKSLPRC